MKTIKPRFDIGQDVNVVLENGKTYRGKIHMIRADWSPYGVLLCYDVTIPYDKEIDDWYLSNISERQISALDVRGQASEQLRRMSFDECIALWNEKTADHYMRAYEIHETDDADWWDWISRELGGYDFMRTLLESGQFNITDRYFFHDKENGQFISFSTKQELLENVGEDIFIEELINRK